MAGLGEPDKAAPGTPTAPAPLTREHDLSRFACGRLELDQWLRNSALDREGRSARTYVACEGTAVVGYYCISTGSVERRDLPPKMKRARGTPNPVPVAIIGRLARDERYAGTGLGKDLLQGALRRILAAAPFIGVRVVLVHALDDEAARFWKAHDFVACPVGARTYVLAIETIADAI